MTPNALYLRLRRIRRELMECIDQGTDRQTQHEPQPRQVAAVGTASWLGWSSCSREGTIRPAERDRLESLLADNRDARLMCGLPRPARPCNLAHPRPGRRSAGRRHWPLPRGAMMTAGSANNEVRAGAPQSVAAPTHDSSFIIRQLDLLGGVVAGYAVAVLLLGSAVLATWAWQRCGDGTAACEANSCAGPTARHPLLPGTSRQRRTCSSPKSIPSGSIRRPRRRTFAGAYSNWPAAWWRSPTGHGEEGAAGGAGNLLRRFVRSGTLLDGLALVYSLQRPDAKTIFEHPLFRIRTPTVVVTDGGGSEFMVGVDKTPESHVSVLGRPSGSPVGGAECHENLADQGRDLREAPAEPRPSSAPFPRATIT